MPNKRSKTAGGNEPSDDETMFLFTNNLMSYFGDDEDDLEIIARLREEFLNYPSVRYNFFRGLAIAMSLSDNECISIVERFANRRAESGAVAREWLAKLHKELFDPNSRNKL